MNHESVRCWWALHYVNGEQFIGRFGERWTLTDHIDCAALFATESEAENALQAFLSEAKDRISDKQTHAADMWWSCYGGTMEVVAVDVVTRLASSTPQADEETTP